MTAEVAVANKMGIALAADSAVTIGDGKIYNSANKLFGLSNSCPVGIMIYGNATLMDIPWEPLIKTFRNHHRDKELPRLEDYSESFMDFLRKTKYISKEAQLNYFYGHALGYLIDIQREIQTQVQNIIGKHGSVTTAQTKQITKQTIKRHIDKWSTFPLVPKTTTQQIAKLKRTHLSNIKKLLQVVFQKLPLDSTDTSRLTNLSVALYSKVFFPTDESGLSSGVVIAGYGGEDIYPKAHAYNVQSVINGILKASIDKSKSQQIAEDNDAFVISFAQNDMVHTFMEGIDPDLRRFSDSIIGKILDELPEVIVNVVKGQTPAQKAALEASLIASMDKISDDYFEGMQQYRKRNYASKVVQIVSVLPKDEIAAMAEALVSLTSFKRRVTASLETVGGPIDVAVISKGDGLVWIKRKNYFPSELNHHFFANKLRQGTS